MPLDPIKIMEDAKRAGLIDGYSPIKCDAFPLNKPLVVWTPAEAGIAPLPKTDRRSRAYRQRPKQPRKWLTKAEAIAKGYSL